MEYYIILFDTSKTQTPVTIGYCKIRSKPTAFKSVRNSIFYKERIEKIKKKGEKLSYLILDKCSKELLKTYAEYYRSQYKTWGFTLVEDEIYGIRENPKQAFVKGLEKQLISQNPKKNHIVNRKLFLFFLSDLSYHFGYSRKIDELLIFLILTFLVGYKFKDIPDFWFLQLSIQDGILRKQIDGVYLSYFTKYFKLFEEKYSNDQMQNEVFIYNNVLDINCLEDSLDYLTSSFGYNIKIRVDDSPYFSTALKVEYLKYHYPQNPIVRELIDYKITDLYHKDVGLRDEHSIDDYYELILHFCR